MAFQVTNVQKSDDDYEVWTDAPQAVINKIQLEIFKLWVQFAKGGKSLGIKPLMNPTGKYASSISMQKEGARIVAVIQDEDIAPEGQWIESGHAQYDMKTLFRGRHFPLHRAGGVPFQKGVKVKGYYLAAKKSGDFNRSADFAGMATVGETGWVIPAMAAYHPAKALADIAEQKLRAMG